MQINSTRCPAIKRLLGLSLLALCFYLPSSQPLMVQAQEQTRQVTVIQDMVSIGLVPGQTLRVGVFNSGDRNPHRQAINGHVKVFDGSGGLLFQTAAVEIAAGAFHSFDIDRADISQPGDLRTGRLQVRLQIVAVMGARGRAARISARIDRLPTSLELIENLSGKTVAATVTRTTLVPIGGAPIPD